MPGPSQTMPMFSALVLLAHPPFAGPNATMSLWALRKEEEEKEEEREEIEWRRWSRMWW